MRPAARVEIAGRDVTTELFGERGVLVSLTVTDEAGLKSDTLELEIDNREDFTAPPKNSEIRVWLGFEPAPVYMGLFKVDEWTKSGPVRTLTVSAKAAEMTGSIRAAKSRAWDGKTAGQIVSAIAGEHGVTPLVDPELAAVAIAHIDQQNESDLHFLTRIGTRVGGTFKLADGKAILAKRGSSTAPSGKVKETFALTPDMVSTWDATSADRGDYKTIKCVYMDHTAGKRVTVSAGSGSPVHRDRKVYASRAEAQAAAKAQLGDLARGKVQFNTDGGGLPDVFAESMVMADGFDPDVDGEYLVKTVTHTFTKGGYTTRIAMETKATGSASED